MAFIEKPIGTLQFRKPKEPKNKREFRSRRIGVLLFIGAIIGLVYSGWVLEIYEKNIKLGYLISILSFLAALWAIRIISKVPIRDDRFQTGYRGNAPRKFTYPFQLFFGCMLISSGFMGSILPYLIIKNKSNSKPNSITKKYTEPKLNRDSVNLINPNENQQ